MFKMLVSSAVFVIELVIVSCIKIEPQGILSGQKFLSKTSASARSFATTVTSG